MTEEKLKGNHYKISKWRAEQVALALAREGLPVVIAEPEERADWAA